MVRRVLRSERRGVRVPGRLQAVFGVVVGRVAHFHVRRYGVHVSGRIGMATHHHTGLHGVLPVVVLEVRSGLCPRQKYYRTAPSFRCSVV